MVASVCVWGFSMITNPDRVDGHKVFFIYFILLCHATIYQKPLRKVLVQTEHVEVPIFSWI